MQGRAQARASCWSSCKETPPTHTGARPSFGDMEGSAAGSTAAGSAASTQQGKVQALLDAGDDPFTLLVPCRLSRCDCHAHSPLLPDAVLLRAQRLPRPELDALDRPRWDVEDSTVTRQYRRVRGPSTPRARHSRWALAPGTDADRAPGVQLSLCCHPDKNETEDAALAFHRAPRVLGSPGRRWLKRVRVAGRRPRRGARPAARSRRADEAAAGHARCGRQVVDHAVR